MAVNRGEGENVLNSWKVIAATVESEPCPHKERALVQRKSEEYRRWAERGEKNSKITSRSAQQGQRSHPCKRLGNITS
jgi:hypothetical protein